MNDEVQRRPTMRGPSARVRRSLSEQESRQLIDRLNRLRAGQQQDAEDEARGIEPSREEAPRHTSRGGGGSATTRRSVSERIAEEEGRGTRQRGLAEAAAVRRDAATAAPLPGQVTPRTTTSQSFEPRPPSRGRTPDPPGVSPDLGQRVDYALGPDPGSGGVIWVEPEPPPAPPAAARRITQRAQDALTELSTDYFRDTFAQTADRLRRAARSRHDPVLRRTLREFEAIMRANPNGIQTRREWERARDIFDEAYESARARYSSDAFWNDIWRNHPEATRRMEELHRQGVLHLRYEGGRPHGTPRIQQYNPRTGRYPWRPLNIDHGVPLERNPWSVLDGENLYVTAERYNQRYLVDWSRETPFPMAVDRLTEQMEDLDDPIERFVLENGLSRQRRASGAMLDARYGRRRPRPDVDTDSHQGRRPRVDVEEPDPSLRGRRRRQRSDVAGTIARIPLLDMVAELFASRSRAELYAETVEQMRERDRRGRRDRIQLSRRRVNAENILTLYERVIGNRHPAQVRQAPELARQFRRWLDMWEQPDGEGWHVHDLVANWAFHESSELGRNERLGDIFLSLRRRMEDLEELVERIDARLAEADWEARATEFEEAADNFEQLLESEIQSFAIDLDDADYLSRSGLRRMAWAYRHFHDGLTELRAFARNAILRYERLSALIDELM